MKWLKLFAGLAAEALFLATVNAAPLTPPVCQPGTLADYEALTKGCTIGPSPTFTFADFSFSVLAAHSITPATAADINVDPIYNGSKPSLQLNFSSTAFSVSSGQSTQFVISYAIDPPPPEIIHFNLHMTPDPPVFPGVAQITTDLCVYALFTGNVCNPPGTPASLTVFDNGLSASLDATTPDFSPVAVLLGVRDTITLDGGATGSASFTSFGNTTSITPEPVSATLCLCGLAFLVLGLRRGQAKSP